MTSLQVCPTMSRVHPKQSGGMISECKPLRANQKPEEKTQIKVGGIGLTTASPCTKALNMWLDNIALLLVIALKKEIKKKRNVI